MSQRALHWWPWIVALGGLLGREQRALHQGAPGEHHDVGPLAAQAALAKRERIPAMMARVARP